MISAKIIRTSKIGTPAHPHTRTPAHPHTNMGSVALQGVEVFARIGVYKEEHQVLRRFIIDIEVEYHLGEAARTDDVRKALNYEDLLNSLYDALEGRYKLMETAAHGMAERILQRYPDVKNMKISIRKHKPFMKGNVQASRIEWRYPEDW
jgi:dihydroneopterin aldolase